MNLFLLAKMKMNYSTTKMQSNQMTIETDCHVMIFLRSENKEFL